VCFAENKKELLMAKNIRWSYVVPIVFFAIFGLMLITRQVENNKVICKPATNPWKGDNFQNFYPNITIAQVCIFQGHVNHDELYEQRIAQGYVFFLKPENGGWGIGMTNERDKTHKQNFSVPVALPAHGLTPLDVWAVTFSDRSSGKELSGNDENPIAVRSFNFVLYVDDYVTIANNYLCWRDGNDCPVNWKGIPDTERSRGTLTITKLKFGTYKENEIAWIDSMDFEVKVYLPAN